MLLKNWKDIKTGKPLSEIYRESLTEDAVIPVPKKWTLNENKLSKNYIYALLDEKEEKDDFVDSLNFNEETVSKMTESKARKLNEGPGAGYTIEFLDLKLKDVKITDIFMDGNEVECAEFEAEVEPGTYHWRAEGYDWEVEPYDQSYDTLTIKSGKLYGYCENGEQAWYNDSAKWTKEDYIDEIKSCEYDVGIIYSGGYIHSDIPDHFEMKDKYPIDISEKRDRYSQNALIDHAVFEIDSYWVNNAIHDAMGWNDSDEDDDRYEDYDERLGEKSRHRLQEGPGAGYHIYFYDIKLQNVKITKIWEDRYGVQYADFTAEIVPGKYDWSADGYDWAVGNRNKEFDGDMTFYDKVEIKEGSTVEGSCENGYQAWGDPNSTWTEEDFIKEIQDEEYVLGELFGGGYIHSDIPDEYHMEDDIDCSDERSGYKNSYVSSADLKLDAQIINQAIEDTRDYDPEEDDEYEDYAEDFEESRRHPDPDKWKKGDWAVYNGKLYVTSLFMGGDMVKLESPDESIVVPQSKVYKATRKDIYHESSVSKRLDEPICFVVKNSETGEYASLDLNNGIEWTKNLGQAESFDDEEDAWEFFEGDVLPDMNLERGEDEEDWEYEERNLDYHDSLEEETVTIEPVYRDSLKEALRERKVTSEYKYYPHGISKGEYFDDNHQLFTSGYHLPYGFRTNNWDDLESWERDLRDQKFRDYEKEASDWLDKNGDAWNTEDENRNKLHQEYEDKVRALRQTIRGSKEYQDLLKAFNNAEKYRDYAKAHNWWSTASKQQKKMQDLMNQMDKMLNDAVAADTSLHDPDKDEDTYWNDFMGMYNKRSEELDSEIKNRRQSFADAAEGKELFSGRDQNNDHHFYYKNGDKYRQIGSRYSIRYPFGTNRGIRDYYESPDATQEFDDYDAEDIRFLKPVSGWDSRVQTKEEDSTD